jgi:tetratricopeptide (TPR) repeat protein
MPRAALALLLIALPAFGADQWLRLTTPDFELYTDAGEKKGRETLLHFEQVRGFFVKASPVRPPGDFPVRIIAFRNREQFQAYAVNPIVSAYFAGSTNRDYIVMQNASPSDQIGSEENSAAIHEYVHLIIRHSGLRIPLWLNEGWAEVYSTLRPVSDGVAVGDLIPGREALLEKGAWMDLNALASIDRHSPAYNEANRASVFYAESWALTHMLFLSPDYRDRFGRFVTALHRGSTLDDSCRSAFDKTSTQVFDDLKSYFARKKLYGVVFNASLDKTVLQPAVAGISEFDSRLILADLLGAIGRLDQARGVYEELDRLQPGRSDVARSLGFLALEAHNAPSAREYFEKAFAAGDADPKMCFVLSILEREAKQPAARIIAPLERAVKSKPDYGDALLQLGLARMAEANYEAAVSHFNNIATVTPERAPAVFSALSYACLETGDVAQARVNLEKARTWARTPVEKQQVARLGQLIEARSSGPFAAHTGEKRQRARGTVQAVECGADASRVRVSAGERVLVFMLPQGGGVEYSHKGGPGPPLVCGPQAPFPVLLEYVPSSVMDQTSAGIVRKIEY